MILCVAANATIDKTVIVSPFEHHQIHRPQRVLALAGGRAAMWLAR
jgi:fructose-1-phosphate kinase PfkB-like protein